MKLLLLRMPFYNLFGIEKYKLNTYPLNLLYLASYLGDNGYECEILDAETMQFNIEQKSNDGVNNSVSLVMYKNTSVVREIMEQPNHRIWIQLREEILRRKPDVLGITCYSSSMNAVRYISALIKESSNIPIIIGGPHVSALPQASLKYTNADYAVFGEGEIALCDLMKSIELKGTTKIHGVCFWNGSKIVCGPRRKLIDDIDILPIPYRNFVDLKSYKSNSHFISTSRGCLYDCAYCASKVTWTRKVRYRSDNSVIQEINFLKEKYGAKFIRIVDDTFTLKKEIVLSICDKIVKFGLNTISFSAGARVEDLDEELVTALKRANFETITLGIESVSPRVLKLMNKQMNIEKAAHGIKLLNDTGIQSYAFFMIGYPDERIEDIQKSKEFIAHVLPNEVEINMVSPYPGTKLWDTIFGSIDPSQINNWYQWFHQGMATHRPGFDLDREYENFAHFASAYKKQSREGEIYDLIMPRR